MEYQLAIWIWELHCLGIPVETYMVPLQGREIMKKLYPDFYKGEDTSGFEEPFKFSDCWMFAFFKCRRFSTRAITTNKHSLADKKKALEVIHEFHLETRAFQAAKLMTLCMVLHRRPSPSIVTKCPFSCVHRMPVPLTTWDCS